MKNRMIFKKYAQMPSVQIYPKVAAWTIDKTTSYVCSDASTPRCALHSTPHCTPHRAEPHRTALHTELHAALRTAHCTAHCTARCAAHCTARCTAHCIAHCTASLCTALQRTAPHSTALHCKLHCTLSGTVTHTSGMPLTRVRHSRGALWDRDSCQHCDTPLWEAYDRGRALEGSFLEIGRAHV